MLEGLRDIVHGSHLHRIDGGAQARVAGHDKYGGFGGLNEVSAGCAGQAQVAHNDVEIVHIVLLDSLFNTPGFFDGIVVAFQQAS